MAKQDEDKLWYALNADKVGVGGVVRDKPKRRKQDKEFEPFTMYAVVFFPRITGIGDAGFYQWNAETLAQTPEAAITKYMDRLAPGCKWEDYQRAGHKVRKVIISDAGPAKVKNRAANGR